MTTIKTFIGTVALLAASTVFAQSDSCTLFPKGNVDGQGSIGLRYAGGYLSVQDVKGTSDNIYGIGAIANVPFCKGIDLIGSIGYASFEPDDVSTKLTTIGGSVKFYNKTEDDVKPYIEGGLSLSIGDVFDKSTNWVNWHVDVGAEFADKWVDITPSISFHYNFRHRGASVQSLQ